MRYREVIHAPVWLLGLIYFFFLTFVLSIWAALGNNPALLTMVILTLSLVAIYFKTALVIEIDELELRVGRAHIAHKYVAEIKVLESAEFRRVRTRDADPAAFLAIRFWSARAVQLFVNDQRDPTPYWLISTANGNELIKALQLYK